MPIKIFAAKSLSGNPFDGVDNSTISVFGRIDKQKIIFFTDALADFSDKGAINHFSLGGGGILRTIKKLSVLRKKSPDLLWGIANNLELLFLIFKPKKTKYVINLHTVLAKKSDYWKVRTPWFFRKFLFSRADKIICVSEFIAQNPKKYFPWKNIDVVLNGVDADFFNPEKRNRDYLNKKFKIGIDKPIVSFVGILHPRKRPDFFIDLARSFSGANFVSVGRRVDGFDFLNNTGNMDNFYQVEKMSREDIAILLASSDVFAFPSLNEPSAAVIGEAMASGAAVITSDSGGNGEFIENGKDGFLVPVDSGEKDAYLKNLKEIINNGGLKYEISKNARTAAINRFSFDKTAKLYENSIMEIL